MGRQGPPPKPTRLKVAAGNPGHRPLNAAEPQPAVAVPACPKWLPKRARAEWKRITPELQRLGLVALVDQAALSGYCVAVAELAATATLEAEGRVCRTPLLDKQLSVVGERLKAHPCVAMQNAASARIKQFISEFGLSPASRTRVHGKPAEADKGDDRRAKFFGTVG